MLRIWLFFVMAVAAIGCGGRGLSSQDLCVGCEAGGKDANGDGESADGWRWDGPPWDGWKRADSKRPHDGPGMENPLGMDEGVGDTGPDAPQGSFKNKVEAENAWKGTDGWELRKPATERQIEGYANATSVNIGETIKLYVNTTAALYTIEVYRLGWYQGKGGRLMSRMRSLRGQVQVVPPPDKNGMVECRWKDPRELSIPSHWVSGVYVAKLIEQDDHTEAYILFVVRDDARASDFLFQSGVTTFQAYNDFGGRSLYGKAAQVISFDRPYNIGPNWDEGSIYGAGAGEFLTNSQDAVESVPRGWEYNMVRFLEKEGYDVTYATNIDLHANPKLLDNHQAMLSVGHDEYWSWEMRDNVERARDVLGVNLGFFGANIAYWQIRLEPSASGVPNRRMVVYKDKISEPRDPLRNTKDEHLVTSLWRGPTVNRPEVELMGVTLQTDEVFADLVVSDASSWVYANTGLKNGDKIPGIIGYEADAMVTWAHPNYSPALKSLAHSPFRSHDQDWYADMVTFQVPSGATVFSAGTIQWSWGLDDYIPPTVPGQKLAHPGAQQITRNVLARLRQKATPLPKPAAGFVETFDAKRPEDWSPGTLAEGSAAYDAAVGVAWVQGQLVISPFVNNGKFAHGGVLSRPFDLRSGSVTVEVKQITSTASGAGTTFAVAAGQANWFRFYVEGGQLFLQEALDWKRQQISMPYSAASHRFWRIRCSSLDGKVFWETSADGTNFTIRHQADMRIDLGRGRVELSAGTYQAEPAPGKAIFDNLKVTQNGFSDTFVRTRNPWLWEPLLLTVASDSRVPLIQHQGRLQIRARSGAAGAVFGGYLSTHRWDFNGAEVRVEAGEVTGASDLVTSSLAVARDGDNWLRIGKRGTQLVTESSKGGVVSSEGTPYNTVAHRWWRIRHDASSGRITWETSADRSSWVVRRAEPLPFAVGSIRFELMAGTAAPAPNPGQATFSRFAFAR